MILDFDTRTTWIELCEALTAEFGFDGDSASVRAYQGVYHALAELTRGLAKQFPTKKEIFYLPEVDPSLEPHAMALAKEGYKLNAISRADLKEPNSLVEKMGRETLCVLLPLEDPVFGLRAETDLLISLVREKKMFMILVSHGGHFYSEPPSEMERPEAIVHSFGRGIALGFLGARYKFGPIVADGLSWNLKGFHNLKGQYNQAMNEKVVRDFEANPPGGANSIFFESQRVFDRACLFWEDIDGSAMIQLLAQKLNLNLGEPGSGNDLETLSLSRWGGINTMNWLQSFELTPQQIRGSVLISAQLIQQVDDLKAKIDQSYEEILKLQSGGS